MSRSLSLYCRLVGAMDLSTGVLLVAAPLVTLGWMGIDDVPSEVVYLRFVGAFVAAVGALYLVPFLHRSPSVRERRLWACLESTAVVRSAVAAFVAAAILRGDLETAWLSVALTDGGLAAFQLALLVRRRGTARELADEA